MWKKLKQFLCNHNWCNTKLYAVENKGMLKLHHRVMQCDKCLKYKYRLMEVR